MPAIPQRAVATAGRGLKLLQPITHTPVTASASLWMAIYLPRLALHAVNGDKTVTIVVETQAGRSVVIACNEAAEALGITAGMTASAALSLCDSLQLFERDDHAECVLLNQVATIAYGFSDNVSLYRSDTVVLEVRGSLKLFGDIAALQSALRRQLRSLQLKIISSTAPTARAAAWLTWCKQSVQLTDMVALRAALRTLPVLLIAQDSKAARQFQNCGIRTLGDCMRLPRKDVNRRFGPQPLNVLQQALGEQPEPLQYYKPLQPFITEWHFDDPVISCALIEKAGERLLIKLQHYLHARCAAVQYIVMLFTHTDRSTSTLKIGSSHYQRDATHLYRLLHEHLHNYVLRQPVTSLSLCAEKVHVLPPDNRDLFNTRYADRQAWQLLLDILRSRLERQSIRLLSSCDDPRPEYAYRFSSGDKTSLTNHPTWPFWLLEKPQKLDTGLLATELKTETGAERIEQGWWSGMDIRRDYYRARHKHGARWWIFQDIRSRQWYLHGLFG